MCAKKVEIDIRVCLNKLPTVLIAHLKRIVFDFDTFENKKINTRFEFPQRLNIANYTKPVLDAKRLGKQTTAPSDDSESKAKEDSAEGGAGAGAADGAAGDAAGDAKPASDGDAESKSHGACCSSMCVGASCRGWPRTWEPVAFGLGCQPDWAHTPPPRVRALHQCTVPSGGIVLCNHVHGCVHLFRPDADLALYR